MEDKDHFIVKRLEEYLHDIKYQSYKQLIEFVKDGDDIKAKYNLMTLLMEYGTEQLCVRNLQERLKNVYCSDENIEVYINKIVSFNPKLGYVSIEASHGRDMENDYSLDIHLPVKSDADIDKYFENARLVEERAKEVLRMILMESKTVCP